ncbi:MAG: hypothetical protein JSS76_01765 [Bacteroidetes bacterium]|nr:hypothetical protein [Bacteroidota bacterium]
MMKGFFLKLGVLTLLSGLVLFAIESQGFFADYQSFVWISLGFMFGVTALVYLIFLRALAIKDHSSFMMAFGSAFAIKSFASLAFVSYFIFFRPIENKYFILPFFGLYFAYTGLLVFHLWQITKRKPLP